MKPVETSVLPSSLRPLVSMKEPSAHPFQYSSAEMKKNCSGLLSQSDNSSICIRGASSWMSTSESRNATTPHCGSLANTSAIIATLHHLTERASRVVLSEALCLEEPSGRHMRATVASLVSGMRMRSFSGSEFGCAPSFPRVAPAAMQVPSRSSNAVHMSRSSPWGQIASEGEEA
eukprot:scaffold47258_cov73-Phaeocystis_antarctica.AAC.4